MPQPLLKSDYELLAELRKSIRRFLRYSEEAAREVGITPQQHQILLAIKGQPDRDWLSIAELAEALQLRHHTVVGLVDRSITAGLVTRKSDPEDRRQVRVMVSDHGEKLLMLLAERNREELQMLRKFISLGS